MELLQNEGVRYLQDGEHEVQSWIRACVNCRSQGNHRIPSLTMRYRFHPFPRLSPCTHDLNRHRHHPAMYVAMQARAFWKKLFNLADKISSSLARRLFLFVPSHTGYFPHIPLLSIVSSSLRSGSSRSRSHNSHCQYSRAGTTRSSRGLFRHLHQP